MKLKWKITLPVLALLILSALTTTILSFTTTRNTVDQIVDNIVSSNLNTLVNLVTHAEKTEQVIIDELGGRSLALTRAFADIVAHSLANGTLELDDFAHFQRIADQLGLTEVNVVDEHGYIIGSNFEDYYGFNYGSADSTRPYLRLIDDPSYEIVEGIREDAISGDMMQYFGVARQDARGFVQVGLDANIVQDFRNSIDMISTVADMRIGLTGHASIIEGGIVVYSPHPELIGEDVTASDWFSQVSSGSGKAWMNIYSDNAFTGFENIGDTTLLVMFPRAEYNDDLSSNIVAAIISIAVALLIPVIIFFLVNRLLKPLVPVTEFIQKSSSMGDFTLQPDVLDAMNRTGRFNDEIDELSVNAIAFVKRITEVSQKLESIANGDLTADITTLSDRDALGHSLNKMNERLNVMFTEIYDSADQVSKGSKKIDDGSQVLAQGSSEQSASIEELSGAISEIAKNTKENAEIASKTSSLTDTIRGNAEKGSRQMGEMMSAVNDINQASQSISKVIKVIDDIAFQTNILALNAAVEAARAGQHGKGFAVVAEEVRNLASKSAEAAKDTGTLIQNSVDKAEQGSRIAGETASSLNEIVSGINETAGYVSEIANSSNEQTRSIEQLNAGIDRVAQVIRLSSATAQESAAASEEMNAQSILLQEMISQFKLKNAEAQTRNFLPPSRS